MYGFCPLFFCFLFDPASCQVKITDFGLAKKEVVNVTRGVGTPAYMAPELFDDEDDEAAPADPKARLKKEKKQETVLRE